MKTKKYNAVLLNKKERRVPFGQRGYQQYKDSTGLGIYTKVIKNDVDDIESDMMVNNIINSQVVISHIIFCGDLKSYK